MRETLLDLCSLDWSIISPAILGHMFHMAWTPVMAGRLKSDYQYSVGIVYDSFPWLGYRSGISPHSSNSENTTDTSANADHSYKNIEVTAQVVLDARAAHTNASLFYLYDRLTMPANFAKIASAIG